jgi:hypothetical protein
LESEPAARLVAATASIHMMRRLSGLVEPRSPPLNRRAIGAVGASRPPMLACKLCVTLRPFHGMAQRLMDVVPAVVATPHPLNTKVAAVFAENLYRFLGDGETLARALHRVRD